MPKKDNINKTNKDNSNAPKIPFWSTRLGLILSWIPRQIWAGLKWIASLFTRKKSQETTLSNESPKDTSDLENIRQEELSRSSTVRSTIEKPSLPKIRAQTQEQESARIRQQEEHRQIKHAQQQAIERERLMGLRRDEDRRLRDNDFIRYNPPAIKLPAPDLQAQLDGLAASFWQKKTEIDALLEGASQWKAGRPASDQDVQDLQGLENQCQDLYENAVDALDRQRGLEQKITLQKEMVEQANEILNDLPGVISRVRALLVVPPSFAAAPAALPTAPSPAPKPPPPPPPFSPLERSASVSACPPPAYEEIDPRILVWRRDLEIIQGMELSTEAKEIVKQAVADMERRCFELGDETTAIIGRLDNNIKNLAQGKVVLIETIKIITTELQNLSSVPVPGVSPPSYDAQDAPPVEDALPPGSRRPPSA